MKPRSLLEKAKAQAASKPRLTTPEERELALAWLKDEVTLTQAAKALDPGKKVSGKALYRFAIAIRDEYRAGRITLRAA